MMIDDDDALTILLNESAISAHSSDGGEAYIRQWIPEEKREWLATIAKNVFSRRKREIEGNLKAHQVLELIALVVSKSYVECGDFFQVADDTALMMIRDLLLRHDPVIVKQYSHTKLSQQNLLKSFSERDG